MAVFGWDVVPYIEDGKLRFVDSYSGLTSKYEKKDKMAELMKYIIQDPWDSNLSGSILGKALNEIDADRLVIDTITSLVHRFGDEAATKFITVFSTKIKAKGIGISTLTSGGQSKIFENYMKSISDGIIELKLEDSHLGLDRYLRVYQMKESTHDSKWHQFILNEDGVAFMQDPANRLPKAL
jgi:KaiC/GvpD/RAD55 family RecA-like ATPase